MLYNYYSSEIRNSFIFASFSIAFLFFSNTWYLQPHPEAFWSCPQLDQSSQGLGSLAFGFGMKGKRRKKSSKHRPKITFNNNKWWSTSKLVWGRRRGIMFQCGESIEILSTWDQSDGHYLWSIMNHLLSDPLYPLSSYTYILVTKWERCVES